MESLLVDLAEIVDVGNADEIKIYDEFLTAKSSETKLQALLALTVRYGKLRKAEKHSPADETIARFLNRLEHCASVLESVLNETNAPSKSIIESELLRVNSFVSRFSLNFETRIPSNSFPEWEARMKSSSNVTELRNAFSEILSLWRIQLSLNASAIGNVARLEDMEDSLSTLKQQLMQAKTELSQLKADRSATESSLSARCRAIESDKQEAKEEVAVLKEKIADMQIELDAAHLEAQTLKTELKNCRMEMHESALDHSSELSRLRQELDDRDTDSQRVIELTERLHHIQRAVSSDFHTLQLENVRLQEQLDKRREQVALLRANPTPPRHAGSLYDKLDELDHEIDSLYARMKDVK